MKLSNYINNWSCHESTESNRMYSHMKAYSRYKQHILTIGADLITISLSQILFVLPLLCDLPLVGLLLVLGLLDLPVGHPHGVVAVARLEGAGRVGGRLQLLGRVHRFGTCKKEFILKKLGLQLPCLEIDVEKTRI